MIKYGLKIWSSNTDWFDEAARRHRRGEFDFAEIYSNSAVTHDYEALKKLQPIPVLAIHVGNLDAAGFHAFFLTEEQKPAWNMTVALTDFFSAPKIVVHPAITHTEETFWENIAKLNDERIVIESMPVVSPLGGPERMFGAAVADLARIGERREVVIDIEKSIKAAVYYGLDYKKFLPDMFEKIRTSYFHISGCTIDHPVDEHGNLWDADFDLAWMKQQLEALALERDIWLVFETPKEGKGLENDVKNMEYFRELKLK